MREGYHADVYFLKAKSSGGIRNVIQVIDLSSTLFRTILA